MSQKMSIGASAPQASQHAVVRGQGVSKSRRFRVAVFSVGVLFLLIKFLAGPSMLGIHIDMSSGNAIDPDDIWDEVSQCCLVLPCVLRVQGFDMAERLY